MIAIAVDDEALMLRALVRAISASPDVNEVIAFSDKEIRLKLKDGSFLYIQGENLKITAFDDGSGLFSASGSFSGAKYKQPISSFVKKVFS